MRAISTLNRATMIEERRLLFSADDVRLIGEMKDAGLSTHAVCTIGSMLDGCRVDDRVLRSAVLKVFARQPFPVKQINELLEEENQDHTYLCVALLHLIKPDDVLATNAYKVLIALMNTEARLDLWRLYQRLPLYEGDVCRLALLIAGHTMGQHVAKHYPADATDQWLEHALSCTTERALLAYKSRDASPERVVRRLTD